MPNPNESHFYKALDPRLCQGDIFACAPMCFISKDATPLRKVQVTQYRLMYELEDEISHSGDADPQKRLSRQIMAQCDFTWAVLLTHDCEIDKPKVSLLHFAIIREFPIDWDEKSRTIVKENRSIAKYYVPPVVEGEPDKYVDFTRITSISPKSLDRMGRLYSLSELARSGLMEQLVRYYIRAK